MINVFLTVFLLNKLNFFQCCILFVDLEGEPAQELSAIAMNAESRQVIDTYHAYAYTHKPDEWSRCHVHGLNPNFLKENGFSDESALVKDFKCWLRGKDILVTYANNPIKEIKLLNLPIKDMALPQWSERAAHFGYQTALAFKKKHVPVFNKICPQGAHSNFSSYPVYRNTYTEHVKKDFGHHCSLYDAFSLYLFYVLE